MMIQANYGKTKNILLMYRLIQKNGYTFAPALLYKVPSKSTGKNFVTDV